MQIGAEQIKSDISALKSGIGNCAVSQDFRGLRGSGSGRTAQPWQHPGL